MRDLEVFKIVAYPPIPGVVGRRRALEDLQPRVDADLVAIKADIATITKSGLGDVNRETMLSALELLRQNVASLPISNAREKLSKQLRFLVLVIENRFDQIGNDANIKGACEQLSRKIGVVPRLNPQVNLPDTQFLPARFDSTVVDWGKIIWRNPSRDSRAERLGFFAQRTGAHSTTSVRAHLIALDNDEQRTDEALSYADADFYDIGNLQADHLQPSDNIVARQLELIEAMNLDPLFRAQVLTAAEGKGYFVIVRDEVCGSKRFFMEYHNCIDNLWLLTTAAGARKGNMDPVLWLSGHERFGEAFIESLGNINRSCILFTNEAGVLLAEAARTWFRQTYAQQITAAHYVIHRIKKPLMQRIERAEEGGSKRRRVKAMARIALASQVAERNSSEHSCGEGSSDIASEDALMSARNMELLEEAALPEGEVAKESERRVVRNYEALLRRRRGDVEDVEADEDGGRKERQSGSRLDVGMGVK